MNLNIFVGLVAVVLLVIGVGGMTGKLPFNWLIGIRVGPVMKSPETWKAGHRAAAPLFVVVAICGLGLLLLEASGAVGNETVHALHLGYMWAILPVLLVGAVLAIRGVRALEQPGEAGLPTP